MVFRNVLIRYRLSVLQQAFPVIVGGVLAFLIVEGGLLAGGSTLSAAEVRNILIAWLAAILVSVSPILPRYGITLTPEAVVITNVRKHTIEWRFIGNIAVERHLGCRMVVLWDDHGRRTMLSAPQGILDRNFDDKVRMIQTYWSGRYDREP
jgi:hypothetical protein